MRTTFRMEDENMSMVRGDTVSFGFETLMLGENDEIVVFDQDLDSVFFTCKRNDTDEVNAFQKSLEDGITKVAEGQYVVRIAPEDTENMEAGKYHYYFKINVNSDTFTLRKGILEIER